jgi:hypothetical protein
VDGASIGLGGDTALLARKGDTAGVEVLVTSSATDNSDSQTSELELELEVYDELELELSLDSSLEDSSRLLQSSLLI